MNVIRIGHQWFMVVIGGAIAAILASAVLAVFSNCNTDHPPATEVASSTQLPTSTKATTGGTPTATIISGASSPPTVQGARGTQEQPSDLQEVAADRFEEGNWVGGSGWLSGWKCFDINGTEYLCEGNGGGFGRPLVEPVGAPAEGLYDLHFRTPGYEVRRPVDLSGLSSARLQMTVYMENQTREDYAECRASPDGRTWYSLGAWTEPHPLAEYEHVDVDLTPIGLTREFWIDCRTVGIWPSIDFYVDDIRITGH